MTTTRDNIRQASNSMAKGFKRRFGSAAATGRYGGVTAHMAKGAFKPDGYWTPDRLIKDANQYRTRNAWRLDNCGAYSAAMRDGHTDQCRNIQQPPRGTKNIRKDNNV